MICKNRMCKSMQKSKSLQFALVRSGSLGRNVYSGTTPVFNPLRSVRLHGTNRLTGQTHPKRCSNGTRSLSRKIHCTCTSRKRYRTKTKVCQGCQPSETRGCLENVAISEYHAGGIARLTLDLLRAQYPTFSSKSFSERLPPISLRLPGVDQIHRKGRQAPAEIEEVVRFTQQCQIMFSRTPTGPCVPWIVGFYDFCSMFPQPNLVTNTASCSVCFSFSICVGSHVWRLQSHHCTQLCSFQIPWFG